MKLKGQLVWMDYLNARLLRMHPAGSGKLLLVGAFVIVVVNLFGGRFLGGGRFPTEYMLLGLVFIVFIVLYRYVLLPYWTKQLFFQQKDLSLPFEAEITRTNIALTNERGTNTWLWTHFTRWKENKDILLLYHSGFAFTVLPKRLFSDPGQVETVKTFLTENKVSPATSGYLYLFGCLVIVSIPVCLAVAMVVMAIQRTSP